MPRIHGPTNSPAILQRPREYALLQQLTPGADGSVDQQAFDKLVSQYGQKKAELGPELSFEDFAALFAAPSTAAESGEGDCVGYAAWNSKGVLRTWRFERRKLRPDDVRIQIAFCGVCHSDIHQARNDWRASEYPMVPGHEIVGFVTEIGSSVTKFKVGDRVGVGCMVNSCNTCHACLEMKEEQLCPRRVSTYARRDLDGSATQGGYSSHIVVTERFVLRVPAALPLAAAAPLLCAGITTFSPIKRYGFGQPGKRIGVAGLGGLGHVAVKILKAMGACVTVISTSPGKRDVALGDLGADAFVLSTDEQQTKAAQGSLDGLISTVPGPHDMAALMLLTKPDTVYVNVGVPPVPDFPVLPVMPMLMRRQVVGSLYGGIRETQECLDFCAAHGIGCDVELISGVEAVNAAMERMLRNDVRFRFVIDVQACLMA